MRRILVVSLMAIILAMTGIAWGASSNTVKDVPQHHPAPVTCTVQGLRPFAENVWDVSKWERGDPSQAVLDAYARRLHCASPNHRRAMKAVWHRDQKAFFEHRSSELFRTRVTPYYGGGRWWAIPYYVVYCESGGRYNDPSAPNGAYSLLTGPLQGVPTWESWRPSWASRYSAPYEAPPKAQDIAAHKLLVAYGLEPWECA